MRLVVHNWATHRFYDQRFVARVFPSAKVRCCLSEFCPHKTRHGSWKLHTDRTAAVSKMRVKESTLIEYIVSSVRLIQLFLLSNLLKDPLKLALSRKIHSLIFWKTRRQLWSILYSFIRFTVDYNVDPVLHDDINKDGGYLSSSSHCTKTKPKYPRYEYLPWWRHLKPQSVQSRITYHNASVGFTVCIETSSVVDWTEGKTTPKELQRRDPSPGTNGFSINVMCTEHTKNTELYRLQETKFWYM